MSEEVLKIAEKRRQVKGKGEKERYIHLKAEFQRIARRDKKVFLSDQCKKIEGNNRMRRFRDLFKKIRDTKGIFYAKMGTIKERNGMDLTEAKDMKKRWQEYTESEFTQSCPTLCDPWTVAHQVPPSMGFSRQEYWSGLLFPSPRARKEKRFYFLGTFFCSLKEGPQCKRPLYLIIVLIKEKCQFMYFICCLILRAIKHLSQAQL